MENNLIGTCIDYTYDGKGIIKNNRRPVFISNLIKGEEVEYKIIRKNKDFDEGQLVKIIKSSNERVKPICPIYSQCGGCNLQHMTYKEQLEFKTNQVRSNLKNIARIDFNVKDCIGMENPYNYRNKVQVPFSTRKKEIIYGFYKEGTHNVIEMNKCYLQKDIVNDILKSVKELFKKFQLKTYDEDKKLGLLRHVLVKQAFLTNQIMIVLITTNEVFPHRKEVVKELLKRFKEVTTIVQNINKRDTNVILGEQETVLFGKGYIEDELLGVRFRISSKSFYQINPLQTSILYSKAIELARLNINDTVLDAYCGIGTISLIVSKSVKEVIGVEIVKEAIADAQNNAKSNGITNANFVCDDASNFMREYSKSKGKIDVVFVDPPRKGCDKIFLDSLIETKPKKIVYISCNPSTLARDLQTLKEFYNIKEVQPVDMFPQTFHVETITLLSLKTA